MTVRATTTGGGDPPRLPPSLPPTDDDLIAAESRAAEIVAAIRRCVDAVRSVEEFADPLSRTRAEKKAEEKKAEETETETAAARTRLRRPPGSGGAPNPVDARLYPALEEAGLRAEDVRRICGYGDSSDGGTGPRTGGGEDGRGVGGSAEGDRRSAVRSVFLPLLSGLAGSYGVLDAASVPPSPSPPAAAGRRGRGRDKPPPPRGLLSVADYADVACLLELTVCASILPHLERNILPTPEERARLLPRALAGRMPRLALAWGRAAKDDGRRRRGSAEDLRRKPPRKAPVGSSLPLEEAAYAADELRRSSLTVGRLVLLDRFRPMLLPRHVADVYAGLFQAERFEAALAQTKIGAGRREASAGDGALTDLLLGKRAPNRNGSAGAMAPDVRPVDAHSRARAYRTLLSGGTRSPPWLRRRVGALLNELATTDLRPVVDTFVAAASAVPGQDMTGAGVRLGRALSAPKFPTEDELEGRGEGGTYGYYSGLFRQLALVLDAPQSNGDANGPGGGGGDPRATAGALTAWAVLAHAPSHVVRHFLLPHLAEGVVVPREGGGRPDGLAAHRSVRRVCSLLSSMPAAAAEDGTAWKVCGLFLSPLEVTSDAPDGAAPAGGGADRSAGCATYLGQLLRIASASSSDVVVHSEAREDSIRAVRTLVRAALACGSAETVGRGSGTEPRREEDAAKALAVSLVRSACVNSADVAGFRFYRSSPGEDGAAETVSLVRAEDLGDAGAALAAGLVGDAQRRADLVVRDVVAPLCRPAPGGGGGVADDGAGGANDDDDDGPGLARRDGEDIGRSLLPPALFRLLLLAYFGADGGAATGGTPGPSSPASLLPASFHRDPGGAKLAAMTMLPALCELCPPASLLLGGDEGEGGGGDPGGSGVLDLVALVLRCAASGAGGGGVTDATELPEGGGGVTTPGVPDDRAGFASFDIAEEVGGPEVGGPEFSDAFPFGDGAESLLSVASLIVSLLIAVLELGAERRSEADEAALAAMVPPLTCLSVLPGEEDSAPGSDAFPAAEATSVARAELAEMASHAAALISSRSADPSRPDAVGAPPSATSAGGPFGCLALAERDLRSDQPPVRARGVASLRRLARGYLEGGGGGGGDGPEERGGPLIVDLGPPEPPPPAATAEADRADLTENLVRICVGALTDSESYVYLAAVQTLVAVADARPAQVIPLLGQAVGGGSVALARNTSPTVKDAEILDLSPAQRTKLAEALVFAIRRRGRGVYVYGRYLMDAMLYGGRGGGSDGNGDAAATRGTARRVQKETDDYFRLGNALGLDGDGEPEIDPESASQERGLRVNAGGPIFDLEEPDLVRASCVLVVAELVSALPSAAVARHCPSLFRFGMDALRLEASRPVRRAAASLCRELYRGLLREAAEAAEGGGVVSRGGGGGDTGWMSLAVGMVAAGEENLLLALAQCVAAADVNDKESVAVRGRTRLYDPATAARCREALNAREMCEDLGVFATASLVVASKEREDRDPAARAIRKRLGEHRKGKGDEEVVRAMKGLVFDVDELCLK